MSPAYRLRARIGYARPATVTLRVSLTQYSSWLCDSYDAFYRESRKCQVVIKRSKLSITRGNTGRRERSVQYHTGTLIDETLEVMGVPLLLMTRGLVGHGLHAKSGESLKDQCRLRHGLLRPGAV